MTSTTRLYLALTSLMLGVLLPGFTSSEVLSEATRTTKVDVFVSGNAGYYCFKIPTIFQAFDSTLLAFAEARGGECWDWDATDIVLKRSSDGGKSWSDVYVVVPGLHEEHRVAGNIAPVQDRTTGRLFLPFNRGNVEAWMTFSDDNGRSWSAPTLLKHIVDPRWTWIGFGPPAGIQAASGRLIVPAYFSKSLVYDNGLLSSTFIMYSDDHGETWQNSAAVSNGASGAVQGMLGNECQIVQLEDGTLLMNSRTLAGDRLVAYSRDDGDTWTEQQRTPLPTPLFGVEGSVMVHTLPNGTEVLYYSGPNSRSEHRLDMSIWVSIDRAASWRLVRLVEPGQVGYSSLLHTHDGKIAILYGFSKEKAIVFVPGKIVLQVYDVDVPYTATKGTARNIAYSDDWKSRETSFDFFSSQEYYMLIIANQVAGVVATFVMGRHLMQFLARSCCPQSCSKHCRRMLPDHPDAQLDSMWSWVDFLLRVDCVCIALVAYILGLLSNLSQYLLKYDDPVRYKRQTMNGLLYGYLVCLTSIWVFGRLQNLIRPKPKAKTA